MTNFFYKAKNGPQEIVTGYIQADDESQAVEKITRSGQTPLEITLIEGKIPQEALVTDGNKAKSRAGKVPLKVLFQFTRQLADLQEAGLPLLRSLQLLAKQKHHPAMTQTVELIRIAVEGGGSLSNAMAQHKQVFPLIYVNMVKAGEVSGQLAHVLQRLAQFLEKEIEWRGKIVGSLLYPTIILVLGILTMFVLLSFVLPRMTALFDDLNSALPLPTVMMIAISHFFAQFWWVMVLGALGLGLWMRSWIRREDGRLALDRMVLKAPLLNRFIEQAEMARFARTLATLLESGVPIPAALESVVLVIGNAQWQRHLRQVSLMVKSGGSLTQALRKCAIFPDLAIDIISIGEESGRLEKGLYKLADVSERGTQEMSQIFITILGPAVLVVVVGLVGFMMVSMLLPMFQMNMIIN